MPIEHEKTRAARDRGPWHWRRISDGDPEAYVRRVMFHQQVSWWRRRRLAERLESEPTERPAVDHFDATALRLTMVAYRCRRGLALWLDDGRVRRTRRKGESGIHRPNG